MDNPQSKHMECRKRLMAGVNGSKQNQQQFGDRLLYVRYRHDKELQRRVTTVEIIVDEKSLALLPNRLTTPNQLYPNENVYVCIDFKERQLRARAKAAGEQWQPEQQRWVIPYRLAVKLGHRERIEKIKVNNAGSAKLETCNQYWKSIHYWMFCLNNVSAQQSLFRVIE